MNELSIKKLLLIQSLTLLGGTIFAWSKLMPQLLTFQSTYGTLLRVEGCTIPNPFLTACFYGSLAFVVATAWSFLNFQRPSLIAERRLRNFLIFCVVFALSVLAYETADFLKLLPAQNIQVSCVPGANPLTTPCFFGLLYFLAAYLVARTTTKRLDLPAPTV